MEEVTTPALPSPTAISQAGIVRRRLTDPQPVLDELAESHGPNIGFGFGPLRMAIIGDPATIRELFAMPNSWFRWNHKFNLLAVVVGPGSMIVSDGDDHKRRRSSVQTAFSRRRLGGWIPMIVDRTDRAIERLLASSGEPVDMYRVGRSLVLEVVIHALFGERMIEHSDEIGELFQRAQDYLELPAYRQVPHPVPFTARARVKADRKRFDELVDDEIERRRRDPSGDRLDVLEALVLDGSLSDAEIRDQVDTLIGAGYDTTAASLAWMFVVHGRRRAALASAPRRGRRGAGRTGLRIGARRRRTRPPRPRRPNRARDNAAPPGGCGQPPRDRHRRRSRRTPHLEGHADPVVGLFGRTRCPLLGASARVRPGSVPRSDT
jgi:cytochrome P450